MLDAYQYNLIVVALSDKGCFCLGNDTKTLRRSFLSKKYL